jgi:hypothetical protein
MIAFWRAVIEAVPTYTYLITNLTLITIAQENAQPQFLPITARGAFKVQICGRFVSRNSFFQIFVCMLVCIFLDCKHIFVYGSVYIKGVVDGT